MIIKEIRDIETNQLTGYQLDGMFVPLDPSNRHYKEIQEAIKQGIEIEPAFTEEERLDYFKSKKIKELKRERDNQVKQIVVTLESGEILDGNEEAQTRMTRAVNALPDDTTTIDWIDHNNETIQLTRPKLLEALRKAGEEETQIYIDYNTKRQNVLKATSICDIYPNLKECK